MAALATGKPSGNINDRPLFEFGTEVVLAEPAWYQFFESPYYNESHKAFRNKIRRFMETEVHPYVDEWEERHVQTGEEMPLFAIIQKAYAAGIYAPQWPVELGGTPPEGGFDAFHDLILCDEVGRSHSSGVSSAFSLYTMALPPILRWGSKYLVDKVARDVITAKAYIALCISEPYAGSDVAGMRATAEKKGDYYVINAEKKWITMGIFANYFTVAARTGPKGHKGISLFLVDRDTPGVTVQRMKLQGAWLSGTSVVRFEDVKIPATHLIGKENDGFKMIMKNFNHERYTMAVQANRASRELLTAAMNHAMNRRTFGKRLIEHQVIRQKLADMAMRIEAVHALIESVTYQMKLGMSDERLGGVTALLKVNATRTTELCVRETSQIFGGASFVRGGIGVRVERAARDVRGLVVPGGSDEILADLAVRQAMMLTARHRMDKELEGDAPTGAAPKSML